MVLLTFKSKSEITKLTWKSIKVWKRLDVTFCLLSHGNVPLKLFSDGSKNGLIKTPSFISRSWQTSFSLNQFCCYCLVSEQILRVRNFYLSVSASQTIILFLENRFHSPGHGGRPQLRLSRVLLSLHSPIHSLCLTLTSSKPHFASQILHGAHSV